MAKFKLFLEVTSLFDKLGVFLSFVGLLVYWWDGLGVGGAITAAALMQLALCLQKDCLSVSLKDKELTLSFTALGGLTMNGWGGWGRSVAAAAYLM